VSGGCIITGSFYALQLSYKRLSIYLCMIIYTPTAATPVCPADLSNDDRNATRK